MNLPRIFAHAFVRRLAFVLAAIVLTGIGIGRAEAADYPDQGQAYAACSADTAKADANGGISQDAKPTYCKQYGTHEYCIARSGGSSAGNCLSSNSTYGYYSAYTFPVGKTCSARTGDGDGPPSNSNAILVGGGSTCYNGCAYSATLGEGSSQWSFSAGQTVTYSSGSSYNPTGAVCDASSSETPESQSEYCAAEGQMTQCLQSDGRHCTTTKSGKRICWRANEAGTKTNGNEAATKSPEGVGINPPPTPPKNNGDWEEAGTGTASVTQGGVTNNYNVTNYNSTYGSEGDGSTSDGDSGGEGDDEGDGDDAQVGGDGTCTGSFTCSGGDPVLCALAKQAYEARCEASDRFDGDASPFPGEGDGGAGNDPAPEDVHKTVTVGLGMLDEGGFLGGGSCPQFGNIEVMGKTIQFDPDGMWCDVIGVARTCLLFLGAFIALGILAGRSES